MKINPPSRPHLDYDHGQEEKLQKKEGLEPSAKKPYIERSNADKGQSTPLGQRKARKKEERRKKRLADRKVAEDEQPITYDEAFDEEWDDDIEDDDND